MTQILCRIDQENKPVIFIADSLKNGQIKAWHEGEQAVKKVGIDYYQTTKPLSEADSKHIANKFKKAMKDDNVYIRQRLPRVYRSIPDILSNGSGQPAAAPAPAKRGTKAARSAAAKARYQQEVAQTSGQPAQAPIPAEGQPQTASAPPVPAQAPKLDLNDPKFAELVGKIAEILKPLL